MHICHLIFAILEYIKDTKIAPEAKIAQVASKNQNFDGRLKRNRDEPNGQKRDKCQKDGTINSDLNPSEMQKMRF